MASQELAAILAKRRARDGTSDSDSVIPAVVSSTANKTSTISIKAPENKGLPSTNSWPGGVKAEKAPVDAPKRNNSLETKAVPSSPSSISSSPISNLARQGSNSKDVVSTDTNSSVDTSESKSTSSVSEKGEESVSEETKANSADSANSDVLTNRRTSAKIQELAGKVGGISMDAMRGVGYAKRSSGSSGTNYEEQAAQHRPIGVAMPGMVAMPGLAKPGVNIPGITSTEDESVRLTPRDEQDDVEQAIMSRPTVQGARRKPSRRPPSKNKQWQPPTATAGATTTASVSETSAENQDDRPTGSTIEGTVATAHAPITTTDVPPQSQVQAGKTFTDDSADSDSDGELFTGPVSSAPETAASAVIEDPLEAAKRANVEFSDSDSEGGDLFG